MKHLTALLLFAASVIIFCLGRPLELKVVVPDKIKRMTERNIMAELRYRGKAKGYASGIIWKNDGKKLYIQTVEHLLPANYKPEDIEIFIYFVGLRKYWECQPLTAKIIWKSPPYADNPMQDLLILEMDRPDFIGQKFRAPKLARQVTISEKVYLVGNPGSQTGTLLNDVVTTYISKVLDSEEEFSWMDVRNTRMIVLDYILVPGFSGSAVWNERGELVGMANSGLETSLNTYYSTMVVSSETIDRFFRENRESANFWKNLREIILKLFRKTKSIE